MIDEEASTDQCSPQEGPPANPCHTDLEDSILLLVILCDLGFFFSLSRLVFTTFLLLCLLSSLLNCCAPCHVQCCQTLSSLGKNREAPQTLLPVPLASMPSLPHCRTARCCSTTHSRSNLEQSSLDISLWPPQAAQEGQPSREMAAACSRVRHCCH